jgi:hypothetical protein
MTLCTLSLRTGIMNIGFGRLCTSISLTAHQVGVAACFLLLSPDSGLGHITLHCASIVSWETAPIN